jgi:hypothetical protein
LSTTGESAASCKPAALAAAGPAGAAGALGAAGAAGAAGALGAAEADEICPEEDPFPQPPQASIDEAAAQAKKTPASRRAWMFPVTTVTPQ